MTGEGRTGKTEGRETAVRVYDMEKKEEGGRRHTEALHTVICIFTQVTGIEAKAADMMWCKPRSIYLKF